MKREDILRIAKGLGAPVLDLKLFGGDDLVVSVEWLVRFAASIAEAEREACVKVCEDFSGRAGDYGWSELFDQYCADVTKAIKTRGKE